MSIATLSNIEKTFGPRVLFEGLSLNVEQGERIGLIGANGSGKTTLFKVLTGQVVPDAGIVALAKGTRVGYLTQDPVFDDANTVMDEAELAFAQLHELSHRLRDIEHEMAELAGEALDKKLRQYQVVQHEFDLAGGYAWRHRLEATLEGTGLPPASWEQNVKTLSGGQRSRLALAKLLISEPELLLLDEPTNHLDLTAIEWLEQYLLGFKGAVVLISHDRYLLDRLATRIVWLHRSKTQSYPGNYSAFIEQRELQELSQGRQFERQQADIEKQKEFIRRFGAGQRSREAQGREKRLNRLLASDQLIQQVDVSKKIKLSLDTDQRAGDQVLAVRDLSKSFDKGPLWKEVRFDARRGDRVGIIGPNGSGKSTLLQILLGEQDADGGTVKWGANLDIGYYSQRLDEFDPDNTVVQEVVGSRVIKDQIVRDTLASMLFRGEDIHKPVGLLSGGERARVRLAQLLIDRPNVLLLDEPTNHLDIASCEAIERALSDFPGTILCVSHDRYFLNKVVTRMLILDPPRLIDFDGPYSRWVEKSAASKAKPAAKASRDRPDADKPRDKSSATEGQTLKPPPKASASATKSEVKKKDNPYLRPFGRLSVMELEKQIAQTEGAIAECQSAFGQVNNFKDPKKAQTVQSQYEQLTQKLHALEEEYLTRESS